jgi:hypothetical protein
MGKIWPSICNRKNCYRPFASRLKPREISISHLACTRQKCSIVGALGLGLHEIDVCTGIEKSSSDAGGRRAGIEDTKKVTELVDVCMLMSGTLSITI